MTVLDGGLRDERQQAAAPASAPAAPTAPPVYRLPAPSLNAAPNELAGMSLFVEAQNQNAPIILALRGALVRAGYRVPLDGRGADAVLSLTEQPAATMPSSGCRSSRRARSSIRSTW
jgi:hypothetical protein